MQKRTPPTLSGAITSYTHSNGSIGVIVEVTCNSDFTARSEEFKELIHNIALQIAATNPKFIRKEDIPAKAFDQQADISDSDSDLKARSAELCLYEQPFIKDNSITLSQLIIGYAVKLREDITVTRFARFSFGDPAITVAETDSRGQHPSDGESGGVTARLPKSPKAGSGAAHADLNSESGSR
jgi:elongation factor Ts